MTYRIGICDACGAPNGRTATRGWCAECVRIVRVTGSTSAKSLGSQWPVRYRQYRRQREQRERRWAEPLALAPRDQG